MKKLLIALLLVATAAFAQDDKKTEDYNTVREFKNKVFEVRNRSPRDIFNSIVLLGSGFKGAAISPNNDLHTITVRDFPENIAAIEDAIKRLDRPVASTPDIELKIAVLIASKTPLAGNPIPEELEPVVKQLQSTLRYSHYGLMTTTVHRTTTGRGLEGSGVADSSLLGLKPNEERPVMFQYNLREVTMNATDEHAIDIRNFEFSMNVPIVLGTNNVQYQRIGFQTPVTVKGKEKVVIGTTTMGDKALVVVVTANVASAQ